MSLNQVQVQTGVRVANAQACVITCTETDLKKEMAVVHVRMLLRWLGTSCVRLVLRGQSKGRPME